MEQTKKKRVLRGKDKDLIFYTLMMLFPVAQFCVMYIGVNFNSILLAFKKIDTMSNTYTWTFANIRGAFELFTTSPVLLSAAKNSLLAYVVLTFLGTPLGLIFSYYIYKKLPMSNAFRVILFLPSIISGIVMVTIFQFFVERAIPAFASQLFGVKMKGLLENPGSRYATIIFYNLWVGFGTSVLMYSNGMSGISQEIVESAHLDGATGLTEFWKITLPMIYPTLSTFLITGIAGLFTNQIVVLVLRRRRTRKLADLRLLSVYENQERGFGLRVHAARRDGLAAHRGRSPAHARRQVGAGEIRTEGGLV